jgi:hypothetical protein
VGCLIATVHLGWFPLLHGGGDFDRPAEVTGLAVVRLH